MSGYRLLFVMGLLLFFAVNTLCAVVLTKYMMESHLVHATPGFVTVDSAELLLNFAQTRSEGISDDDWADQLRALNRDIEPAVRRLSAQHGVVVLNSAAVLTGAPNYTSQLMAILSEREADQ